AVGDAGRGEQHVAARHLVGAIDLGGGVDAHLGGAFELLGAVEHEAALYLAADAAQRRRGEHPFRRPAAAPVDVDAGLVGPGRVDHGGDVAVRDQAYGGADIAHLVDQPGVTRAVEDAGGDLGDVHALRPRQVAQVLLHRSVEGDEVVRIAGAD